MPDLRELLVALLTVAVFALLLQRTQAWLARCLALAALLLLLAGALAPPTVQWQPLLREPVLGELAGAQPLQPALRAAARAGPRAADLHLQWQQPVAIEPVLHWPLGAAVQHVGEALPWDAQELQLECLRPPVVDRPNALRLRLPAGFAACRGQLRLTQGERVLLDLEVVLSEGLEQQFVPTTVEPLHLELSFRHGEHQVRRLGQVAVAPAMPVVVWEPGSVLAPALQAQGMPVRHLASLADWPANFDAVAAVVLAAPVPEELVPGLQQAVDAGLGLLVTAPAFGGETSALRALLPVTPVPPATERDPGSLAGQQPDPMAAPPAPADAATPPPPPPVDPRSAGPVGNEPIEVDKHAIAMVLVIDRSGSMGALATGGMTRMDYARASALQTSEALQAGDQVGLVTFGNKGAGRIELPLTDALDRDTIRRGVAALGARREFTYLLSGLQRADEMLQASVAAVKHVVVISDGEFDLNENLALARLAREMRGRGTTVSIISIIAERSADLFQSYANQIASNGGGKYLAESDPAQVPVFVSAEVTRALQRVDRQPRNAGDGSQPPPLAKTPPPPPADNPPLPDPPQPASTPEPPPAAAMFAVHAVLPSPLLEPLPDGDWPALAAAQATQAPLDATVLLAAGESGWPLLAFAHRGLGRTGVFASDLAGPAASDFRRDPQFSARLARWLDHLARSPGLPVPVPLLHSTAIEPPAPTPREQRQLAALAGTNAVAAAAGALPAPGPAVQRSLRHPAREWALPALLALLLLALVERWAHRSALAGQT